MHAIVWECNFHECKVHIVNVLMTKTSYIAKIFNLHAIACTKISINYEIHHTTVLTAGDVNLLYFSSAVLFDSVEYLITGAKDGLIKVSFIHKIVF